MKTSDPVQIDIASVSIKCTNKGNKYNVLYNIKISFLFLIDTEEIVCSKIYLKNILRTTNLGEI